MSNVVVRWYADDGYIYKDRPKNLKIDVSDFIGLSAKDAEELLNELMQEEFSARVCWSCADYEASLAEIMAAAASAQTSD